MKHTIHTVLAIVTTVFFNCSSAKQSSLNNNHGIKLGEVYYTTQTDKSLNLYVEIQENPNKIELNEVYFRGNMAKLKLTKNNVYEAHFSNQPVLTDIIMSSDITEEYGNTVPNLPKKMPFKLNNSECAVTYVINKEQHFLKIENVDHK